MVLTDIKSFTRQGLDYFEINRWAVHRTLLRKIFNIKIYFRWIIFAIMSAFLVKHVIILINFVKKEMPTDFKPRLLSKRLTYR